MSLARTEQRIVAVLRRTPLSRVVAPRRAIRFGEYLAVGASGAVIDVALTATALGVVHYLLANAVGFGVANSWNFALNRRITFDSPEGSVSRQYAAYLCWHLATFGVRLFVLTALIEVGGAPVLVASVVGIAAASVANFAGSERIFGTTTVSPDALRAGAGRTLNRLVHAIYSGRVRAAIDRAGLYPVLFATYQRCLGRLYPDDRLAIEIGAASATVHMETNPEILSILHTLRKEREMLEDFARSIRPDDVVWDVGANLGVFAHLAADRAPDGHVVAFEPFYPTAQRLQDNVDLTDPEASVDVVNLALSDAAGETTLGIDRDELGTQTPTLEPRAGQEAITIREVPGDRLVRRGIPAPDVLKVDVEGAELAVLDGLDETLPDCRLVYVEDHAELWGCQGDVAMLRDRFQALGFDVSRSRHGGQTYLRAERVADEPAQK